MAADMTNVNDNDELQPTEMIEIKQEIFEPLDIKTEPSDEDWDESFLNRDGLKQVNVPEDAHFDIHGGPEAAPASSPVTQFTARIKTEPTSDPLASDAHVPSKDELLYGNSRSLNPLLEDEKIESVKCEPDATENNFARSEILRELLLTPSSSDQPEALLRTKRLLEQTAPPDVADHYRPSSNHLNQSGPGSATGAMCVIPREVGLQYVEGAKGDQQKLKHLGVRLIKHLKEMQLQAGWDPDKWKRRKIRENVLRRMREKFEQRAKEPDKPQTKDERGNSKPKEKHVHGTQKCVKSKYRVQRIQQVDDKGDVGVLNVNLDKKQLVEEDKEPVSLAIVDKPHDHTREVTHEDGIGRPNVEKPKCHKPRVDNRGLSKGLLKVDIAKCQKRRVDEEVDKATCQKRHVDEEGDIAKCRKRQQLEDRGVTTILDVDVAKCRKRQQLEDRGVTTILNVDVAKCREAKRKDDGEPWARSFWGCSLCKEEHFFSSSELLGHKATVHPDESMLAYFVSPVSVADGGEQTVTTSSVSPEGTTELDRFPIVSERLPDDLRSLIVAKIRALSTPPCRPRARGTANSSICEFCGKVFRHLGDCNKHRRSHTGERPHVCDVGGCRTSFTTHSNLARHRKLHLGVRYRCEACNAAYSRRDKLVAHARVCRQTRIVPDEEMTMSDSDGVLSSGEVVKTKQGIVLFCRICKATFLNVFQFIEHKDTHTATELSGESSGSNTETSETRDAHS